jgi:hypothetical protein
LIPTRNEDAPVQERNAAVSGRVTLRRETILKRRICRSTVIWNKTTKHDGEDL